MISAISENTKPITIPPEYVQYTEKHAIYELTQKLLRNLIIDRPDDPISYLIDVLGKELDDYPSIFIFGPLSSGKQTIAEMLAEKLKCVVINEKEIYSLNPDGEDANPKEIATALKRRLKDWDCERKGYIVVGFPENESQAKALRWEGVFPEYAIFLEAPIDALIERERAKRIDPTTGEQYHLISNPPPTVEIESRLVPLENSNVEYIRSRIEEYDRENVLLQGIYATVAKTFQTDRPLTDVYTSVLRHVLQPRRSLALRTPRIILLGFAGSGRSTQAELLASKYGLVDVDCGLLIKTEIANYTLLGKAMKSYADRELAVPDAIVLETLKKRLTQSDCSTRGWVLHGYPRTRVQAELLDAARLTPNRIFTLDMQNMCAAERLTGRRVDPVTGVRFHLAYRPSEEKISERMLQNPDDVECLIGSKLARYAAHCEQLFEYYSKNLIRVDASLDAHSVFEQIEAGLVNPLPRVAPSI